MDADVVRHWLSRAANRSARAVLVPRVAWLGARNPRDPHVGWDQFWQRVVATGDGGDVLWDSSSGRETRGYLNLIRERLDRRLPVVDVGCGNGRFTRVLAREFPTALGVDLSPYAIARTRDESLDVSGATYLALDAAAAGSGRLLRAQVGEANVFVRGVFHVLDRQSRISLAANLLQLVGKHGRVFLAETDYHGSALGYLEHLGASPRGIPPALGRAITSLPRPGHFGEPERIESFPDRDWELVEDGATTIDTVPMRGSSEAQPIPGYFAVLAPRPSDA
jgi:SAM-dependent methyltransferase